MELEIFKLRTAELDLGKLRPLVLPAQISKERQAVDAVDLIFVVHVTYRDLLALMPVTCFFFRCTKKGTKEAHLSQ